MGSGGKKQKGSVLNNAERLTLHVPRQATGRQLGAGWRSPLSQILCVSTLCANTSLGLCFYPLLSSLQITAHRSSPLCLRLSIMNNFSIPVPYIQPRVSNLTVGKVSRKFILQKQAISEGSEGVFHIAGSPLGLTFSSLLGLSLLSFQTWLN